uniref:Uncharacterized protein n=1 Tax=Anguilla anguilla TaxID=7936 RepID=A0A0E9R9C7_ANGAN
MCVSNTLYFCLHIFSFKCQSDIEPTRAV